MTVQPATQKSENKNQSWFYPNPDKDYETITETNPDGTTTTYEKCNPSITGLWNGFYMRIPKSDIAKRYEWLCLLLHKCPAYVIRMIIDDSPDNPQYVTITCDDAGLLVEIR